MEHEVCPPSGSEIEGCDYCTGLSFTASRCGQRSSDLEKFKLRSLGRPDSKRARLRREWWAYSDSEYLGCMKMKMGNENSKDMFESGIGTCSARRRGVWQSSLLCRSDLLGLFFLFFFSFSFLPFAPERTNEIVCFEALSNKRQ